MWAQTILLHICICESYIRVTDPFIAKVAKNFIAYVGNIFSCIKMITEKNIVMVQRAGSSSFAAMSVGYHCAFMW